MTYVGARSRQPEFANPARVLRGRFLDAIHDMDVTSTDHCRGGGWNFNYLRRRPVESQDQQGKIHGKLINDGKVRAFLGLPYAAPPVGELRWKAPQPPARWKGVREATSYGAHCVQSHPFADMIFQDSGPSEDCLYLNVYAPADAKPKSKLPVMFWIHGGGYEAVQRRSRAITAIFCRRKAWCW